MTIEIPVKLKREFMVIAHEQGMVLNEYLNILLINKIPWNMPRPIGSLNKITSEVRIKLQNLIDTFVNSIDVNSMDTNQKPKLLQQSLHYVVPKLRSTETSEKPYEDEPLFID